MKVIWMPFAQNEVRKTARYINKEFGKESRDQFINEVRSSRGTLRPQHVCPAVLEYVDK